ncbi:MAG: 6-hydroxymethylpterin diphosphokinase MptE-like protein [Thermodesulfobacteriota bacterium]
MVMAAMAQSHAESEIVASLPTGKANAMHKEFLVQGNGEWWEANIASLQKHRPELYALLLAAPPSKERSPVATTPWPGIASHLETVSPEAQGLVVFLGMGLGCGPLLILRERPAVAQIAIVEPSLAVFRAALQATDLRPLFAASKVFFFVGDFDWDGFETAVTRVAALEDTHVLRHVPSFQWQPELYGPVNDRAYLLLNQLNASGSTTRQCGPVFVENRFANLALLNRSCTLDALRDCCKNKPAVLVAAGPSLNSSLPELRQLVGRCVLIAADSALAPLLQAGIVPDFVTSIDYLDLNFEKVAPFLEREWPLSLVAMVKSTPLMAKRFPARHLFLAFAEDYPQQWIIDALGVRTLAQNASSVAHLSLGLALVMGCDPVIMVGQDLSYTTALGDHAEGTIIMRDKLPHDREIFDVPAVGGGTVPTDRQFLSLLKTFEDIIGATPRLCVNASAAGARITGTMEMGLAEASRKFLRGEVAVGAIVEESVKKGPHFRVAEFLAAGSAQIAAIRKMEEDLAVACRMGQEAQKEVARLAKKPGPWRSVADLPASSREILGRLDRFNGELDSVGAVWLPLLELTFGMLSDNDRQRERNELVGRREGYIPWVTAELARIQGVNQQRLEVLQGYAEKLEKLLVHLEAEAVLSECGCGAGEEQLAVQLAAGNYAVARRLANGLKASGPVNTNVLLLSGEANAGMLDFVAAANDWQGAEDRNSGVTETVAGVRRKFCEEWFGFAQRYANPGAGGDNFPHLLPRWVARIVGAAGGCEGAANLLRPFFENQVERLTTLLEKGEGTEVGDILRAWELVDGESSGFLILLARWHACQGRSAEAIREMERFLARDPANLDGLHFVIRTFFATGRYDEGLARLQRAVAENPRAASLWEVIGDTLFSAADYAAAAVAYERCFLALPGRLSVLLKMGNCYVSQGQTAPAVAAYEAVLARDPECGEARRLLAEARRPAG